MADVKSGQILAGSVEFGDPVLNVVPDPPGSLKPGRYTFALIVTDDAGQRSQAATWPVEVRDVPGVTIEGPKIVAFNQNIPLTAKVSTNGPIKSYTWSVKVG